MTTHIADFCIHNEKVNKIDRQLDIQLIIKLGKRTMAII
jgi:hypothetical protein